VVCHFEFVVGEAILRAPVSAVFVFDGFSLDGSPSGSPRCESRRNAKSAFSGERGSLSIRQTIRSQDCQTQRFRLKRFASDSSEETIPQHFRLRRLSGPDKCDHDGRPGWCPSTDRRGGGGGGGGRPTGPAPTAPAAVRPDSSAPSLRWTSSMKTLFTRTRAHALASGREQLATSVCAASTNADSLSQGASQHKHRKRQGERCWRIRRRSSRYRTQSQPRAGFYAGAPAWAEGARMKLNPDRHGTEGWCGTEPAKSAGSNVQNYDPQRLAISAVAPPSSTIAKRSSVISGEDGFGFPERNRSRPEEELAQGGRSWDGRRFLCGDGDRRDRNEKHTNPGRDNPTRSPGGTPITFAR
jgi:hypothetical protein